MSTGTSPSHENLADDATKSFSSSAPLLSEKIDAQCVWEEEDEDLIHSPTFEDYEADEETLEKGLYRYDDLKYGSRL